MAALWRRFGDGVRRPRQSVAKPSPRALRYRRRPSRQPLIHCHSIGRQGRTSAFLGGARWGKVRYTFGKMSAGFGGAHASVKGGGALSEHFGQYAITILFPPPSHTSGRSKFLGGSVTQRCASRAATSGLGLEKQAIWCGGDRARVGLGWAIWSEHLSPASARGHHRRRQHGSAQNGGSVHDWPARRVETAQISLKRTPRFRLAPHLAGPERRTPWI